jgi:hypothetical protein
VVGSVLFLGGKCYSHFVPIAVIRSASDQWQVTFLAILMPDENASEKIVRQRIGHMETKEKSVVSDVDQPAK